MNWQESEHPRDKDGKFTNKYGENNSNSSAENPTFILYGKTIKNEQDNNVKSNIKSKLLNILGNKATHSDVLYGDEKSLIKKIKENGLVDKYKQVFGAVASFKNNYHDIKEANTKNADKYFHAKANCQASQYGTTGEFVARKLSDLREDTDIPKNKYIPKHGKKMNPSEIIIDYREDQSANLYGRIQGRNNKNKSCKDLVNKYRPNGLNERY